MGWLPARRGALGVSCLLVFCTATRARQTCIDFDDLECGSAVTTQYDGVTFSADPILENRTDCNFDLGTSAPAYLCTAFVGSDYLTCTDATYVVFDPPVRDLSFLAAGDGAAGVAALCDVYVAGEFAATVEVVTDGDGQTADPVDLGAFTQVTRIELHAITDVGGLAWDDFCFCAHTTLAQQKVRLGTPSNPLALAPGRRGPVAGEVWRPSIEHVRFLPGAVLDGLLVSERPANISYPAVGTLLVDLGAPYVFSARPGAAFEVQVPSDCALVGFELHAQGVSTDGVQVRLTNALDIVVGDA